MDALIAIIIGIGNFFLRGVLLMKLWFWFIVPLGVNPIVFWQGIGISMLITAFTLDIKRAGLEDVKGDFKLTTKALGYSIVYSVMFLFGYLFSLGM